MFVTSSHILDVGDDADWKSFGDKLVVGPDVQGNRIAFVDADSVDECKKEGRSATCKKC